MTAPFLNELSNDDLRLAVDIDNYVRKLLICVSDKTANKFQDRDKGTYQGSMLCLGTMLALLRYCGILANIGQMDHEGVHNMLTTFLDEADNEECHRESLQ